VLPSLNIVHLVTKPVVAVEFLQDWLGFLSTEQGFGVHLMYTETAFEPDILENLSTIFSGTKLHRIEKAERHGAKDQAVTFLADYLDLRYLSEAIGPALVHSHDAKSLFLSRFFFPNSTRLHSWWLEDRSAHKLWRVTVERMADYRTWETTGQDETPKLSGPLASVAARQIALPTPETLSEEYERGDAFATVRELYRTILRETDLRAKA